MKKITRKDFAEMLADCMGLSEPMARKNVDVFFGAITDVLSSKTALRLRAVGWITPKFKKGGRPVREPKYPDRIKPMHDIWAVTLTTKRHVDEGLCRCQFIKYLTQRGMTQTVATLLYETFVDEVEKVKHDANRSIEIRGVGSFKHRVMGPRKGHNPKTLERIDVPAKGKVHYKVSRIIKKRINE